jgi:hypothetical protein
MSPEKMNSEAPIMSADDFLHNPEAGNDIEAALATAANVIKKAVDPAIHSLGDLLRSAMDQMKNDRESRE